MRSGALTATVATDEHFGDLVCAMVDTLPHDDALSLAFFFHILGKRISHQSLPDVLIADCHHPIRADSLALGIQCCPAE